MPRRLTREVATVGSLRQRSDHAAQKPLRLVFLFDELLDLDPQARSFHRTEETQRDQPRWQVERRLADRFDLAPTVAVHRRGDVSKVPAQSRADRSRRHSTQHAADRIKAETPKATCRRQSGCARASGMSFIPGTDRKHSNLLMRSA